MMCETALGVLGASLQDWLTWTVKDYVLAVKGYQIRRKEEWEMVRWISYYSLVGIVGSDKANIWLPGDDAPSYKNKQKAKFKWRK